MQKIIVKILFCLAIACSATLPAATTTDGGTASRALYDNSNLLSEIFIKRHSGKNFVSHPVEQEQLQALIQSARWTPSSFNDQPWNFIFCDRFANTEAYLKVADSIYGQDWTENVALFVVVIARTEFRYNGEANEWAHYDTGAAALAMSLQAADIGLMAHQIGGFDAQAIQQDFQLPAGYTPLAVIAIGYEDTQAATDDEPRTRLPVENNFFSGAWGHPLN